MSFHGGFTGCVVAVVLFARTRGIPILSLGDLTCAVGADRHISRPHRQFHQWRIVGPPDRRAVGDGVSRRRSAAAPSEPALRGRARGPGAARRAGAADARRRAEAARPDHRQLRLSSMRSRASTCEFFREPDAQLGFLWGGATMGQLLSIPLFIAGLCFIVYALKHPLLQGTIMADVLPLEAEIRRRIAAAGPMPVAEYMALCLTDPRARLLHHARSARRARRFHHRAGSQPDVRRDDRAVDGRGLEADGRAGKPAHHRTRPRPRHLDEGRAARGQGDAGVPRRRRAASGRDQPGAARSSRSARSSICIDADVLASLAQRRAERPRHHRRQRILRRAAGQPSDKDRTTAGTNARSKSMPPASSPSPSRPIRCRNSTGCCRPRRATRPIGSIFEWRADTVAMELGRRLARDGGAALVIDYGHAESAVGDTLQAVGQHAYADPLSAPGNARSHRACGFPGAGEGGRGHGRAGFGPLDAIAHSCAVSASSSARLRSRSRTPTRQPPTSTPRWRA